MIHEQILRLSKIICKNEHLMVHRCVAATIITSEHSLALGYYNGGDTTFNALPNFPIMNQIAMRSYCKRNYDGFLL